MNFNEISGTGMLRACQFKLIRSMRFGGYKNQKKPGRRHTIVFTNFTPISASEYFGSHHYSTKK